MDPMTAGEARVSAVRAAIADALGLGHPPHAGCVAINRDVLDRAALAAIRADRAWMATVENAARYE